VVDQPALVSTVRGHRTKGGLEMRRLLLLVALLGGIAIGALRLLRLAPGTLRRTTQRAAETVRGRGPGVAGRAADGIEKVGDVAEKGAARAREFVTGEEEEPTEETPDADER
jgi:hypothetical protein